MFSRSIRLGLAWSAIILFVGAYPAIQFEGRHWFHVRFVPWFAALIVAGEVAPRAWRGWHAYRIGVAALIGLLVTLGITLALVRQLQQRSASALFESYLTTPTSPLPFDRPGPNEVRVSLTTPFEGPAHDQRQSELLAIELSSQACAGTGPLVISPSYEALSPALDLSTDIEVTRPVPGRPPTQLFVPVFASRSRIQSFQKLSRVLISGAPSDCVANVSLVNRKAAPPLWLQVVLEPGWRGLDLHQRLKVPRVVSPLLGDRW